jgi:D-alanyl-D-alanine dipeptidase
LPRTPRRTRSPRYATTNNFVGQQLHPTGARCLVRQDLAQGLAAAADVLRMSGEVLVFSDCYRPHDVQARMFEAVPNPNWVARRHGHRFR